jgi:hypothetical protein
MDLRLPSGLFFAILGVILTGLGVFWPDMRAPLTDININLYAGLCMLVFGAFLLVMAWRASHKQA